MAKSNFTTPEEVQKMVSDGVDSLNKTMGAVVLVLAVAFVTLLIQVSAMLLDIFQERTQATNDLRSSVDDLSLKILNLERCTEQQCTKNTNVTE